MIPPQVIFLGVVLGLVVLYVAGDWLGKYVDRRLTQRRADREAAYRAWCARVGEPTSPSAVVVTIVQHVDPPTRRTS